MITLLRASILLLLATGFAVADDWPAWRGPEGNGHSADKNLPTKWSRTENVRWKVALPDEGNSTPIVWGDRIFLTQATDKVDWPPKPSSGGPASAQRRLVMCFQRRDGKLLWQRETVYKETEITHATNPFCAASPVTDGERVIAAHGSAGLVCYDFAGNELWRYDLGKLEHIWGNASSPILYQDYCIQWAGPGERQFLVAVEKKTGKKVWQHDEPGGDSGKAGSKNWIGSWSTPIVVPIDGHDELILGVPGKVKGFDPATGRELWSCSGLGKLVYTSPLCSPDGIVVAMGGYTSAALAVRAGGKGDVTATHRLWLHPSGNPQRIGTGVLIGDHLYLINEPGLAQCFELKTGKDLWNKHRVTGSTWGSLVAADGKLYVTNSAGRTLVLAANPQKPEVLAENELDGLVRASPVIADGDILIRTYKHLWCIGNKK